MLELKFPTCQKNTSKQKIKFKIASQKLKTKNHFAISKKYDQIVSLDEI